MSNVKNDIKWKTNKKKMMRMIFLKTNLYSKGVVVVAVAVVVALSQTLISSSLQRVVRTDWWGIVRNCVVGV